MSRRHLARAGRIPARARLAALLDALTVAAAPGGSPADIHARLMRAMCDATEQERPGTLAADLHHLARRYAHAALDHATPTQEVAVC